jgi:hypothetical protein
MAVACIRNRLSGVILISICFALFSLVSLTKQTWEQANNTVPRALETFAVPPSQSASGITHQNMYDTQEASSPVANASSTRKSWVPKYATDEANHPEIDTTTYIQDRIDNLSQTIRTLPRQPFLESSVDQHAVFYNAYVRQDNEAGVFRLMIYNQMRGVRASLFSKSPIYYNLIGFNTTRHICQTGNMCHQLRYMEEGGEVDTLQDLYEYCVERPDDIVVYLHDKGSFHANPSNARMRRLATKAALTPECYNLTSSGSRNSDTSDQDHECNVCSLSFNFVHHHHSSGNMFTAKCSYVSTLIPPKEFELKRLKMFRQMQLYQAAPDDFSCFRECILDGSKSNNPKAHHTEIEYSKLLGIGRYSYETWIYSSPTVQPCFVFTAPANAIVTGFEHWDANLTRAHDFHISKLFGADKFDYFHGYGKLFEYRQLYGSIPRNTSWFWKVWDRHINAVPGKEKCDC